MAGDSGKVPDKPAGIWGRLTGRLGGKPSPKKDDEGKGHYKKASLGKKNAFYYDEELKCWREKGKDIKPEDLPPPPPPIFSTSSSMRGSARGSQDGSEGGSGLATDGDSDAVLGHGRSWSAGSLDSAGGPPLGGGSHFSQVAPPSGGSGSQFRARNLRGGGASRRYADPGFFGGGGSGGSGKGEAGSAPISPFVSPSKPPLAPNAKVAMFVPSPIEAAKARAAQDQDRDQDQDQPAQVSGVPGLSANPQLFNPGQPASFSPSQQSSATAASQQEQEGDHSTSFTSQAVPPAGTSPRATKSPRDSSAALALAAGDAAGPAKKPRTSRSLQPSLDQALDQGQQSSLYADLRPASAQRAAFGDASQPEPNAGDAAVAEDDTDMQQEQEQSGWDVSDTGLGYSADIGNMSLGQMHDSGQIGSEITLGNGMAGFQGQPADHARLEDVMGDELDTFTSTSAALQDESVGENALPAQPGSADDATAYQLMGDSSWGADAAAGNPSVDPNGNPPDASSAAEPVTRDYDNADMGTSYGGDAEGGGSYAAMDLGQGGYAYDAGQPGGEALGDASGEAAAGPYGGYTWEQVHQWADYYRAEGYSEEDTQAWIRSIIPDYDAVLQQQQQAGWYEGQADVGAVPEAAVPAEPAEDAAAALGARDMETQGQQRLGEAITQPPPGFSEGLSGTEAALLAAEHSTASPAGASPHSKVSSPLQLAPITAAYRSSHASPASSPYASPRNHYTGQQAGSPSAAGTASSSPRLFSPTSSAQQAAGAAGSSPRLFSPTSAAQHTQRQSGTPANVPIWAAQTSQSPFALPSQAAENMQTIQTSTHLAVSLPQQPGQGPQPSQPHPTGFIAGGRGAGSALASPKHADQEEEAFPRRRSATLPKSGSLSDWLQAPRAKSGKLTGPLPWEMIEEEDEETDSTPRTRSASVSPKAAAAADQPPERPTQSAPTVVAAATEARFTVRTHAQQWALEDVNEGDSGSPLARNFAGWKASRSQPTTPAAGAGRVVGTEGTPHLVDYPASDAERASPKQPQAQQPALEDSESGIQGEPSAQDDDLEVTVADRPTEPQQAAEPGYYDSGDGTGDGQYYDNDAPMPDGSAGYGYGADQAGTADGTDYGAQQYGANDEAYYGNGGAYVSQPGDYGYHYPAGGYTDANGQWHGVADHAVYQDRPADYDLPRSGHSQEGAEWDREGYQPMVKEPYAQQYGEPPAEGADEFLDAAQHAQQAQHGVAVAAHGWDDGAEVPHVVHEPDSTQYPEDQYSAGDDGSAQDAAQQAGSRGEQPQWQLNEPVKGQLSTASLADAFGPTEGGDDGWDGDVDLDLDLDADQLPAQQQDQAPEQQPEAQVEGHAEHAAEGPSERSLEQPECAAAESGPLGQQQPASVFHERASAHASHPAAFGSVTDEYMPTQQLGAQLSTASLADAFGGGADDGWEGEDSLADILGPAEHAEFEGTGYPGGSTCAPHPLHAAPVTSSSHAGQHAQEPQQNPTAQSTSPTRAAASPAARGLSQSLPSSPSHAATGQRHGLLPGSPTSSPQNAARAASAASSPTHHGLAHPGAGNHNHVELLSGSLRPIDGSPKYAAAAATAAAQPARPSASPKQAGGSPTHALRSPLKAAALENGNADVHGNGSLTGHAVEPAAMASQEQLHALEHRLLEAHADNQQLQGRLHELEAQLGALRDSVALLTRENEALAEEGLAKDDEIDTLTGQLAHARRDQQQQQQHERSPKANGDSTGMSASPKADLGSDGIGGFGSAEWAAEFDALSAELAQLRAQLEAQAGREAEVAELQAERESADASVSDLKEQLAEQQMLAEGFSDFQQQLAEAEQELAHLREQLARYESGQGQAPGDADAEAVAEAARGLSPPAVDPALVAQLQQRTQEYEAALSQSSALEAQLADIRAKADATAQLQMQMAAVQADKDDLQAQLEALHAELATLRQVSADTDNLRQELEQSAAGNDSLQRHLEQLRVQLEQQATHAQTAQEEAAQLKEVLAEKDSQEAELTAAWALRLTALEQQLSERHETIAALQGDLMVQRAELPTLQQQIQELDASLAASHAQLASRDAELDSLQQRLNERDMEVASLQDQLAEQAAQQAQHSALQQQLGERESELAALKQQLVEVRRKSDAKQLRKKLANEVSKREALEAELAALHSQPATGNADHEAELADLRDQVAKFKDQQALDFERIGQLAEQCEQLQEQQLDSRGAEEAEGVLPEAAEKLAAAESARAELAAEVRAYSERLAAAEAAPADAKSQFEATSQQLAVVEPQRDQLRADLEAATHRVTDLDAERAALAEQASAAQEAARQLEARLAEVEGQAAEAEALKARLAELQSESETLRLRVAELEGQTGSADELQSRIADLEAENDALFARVSETEDEVQLAENKARAAQQEHDRQAARITALEAEIAALGERLSATDAAATHLADLQDQLDSANLEKQDVAAKAAELETEAQAAANQLAFVQQQLAVAEEAQHSLKQASDQSSAAQQALQTENDNLRQQLSDAGEAARQAQQQQEARAAAQQALREELSVLAAQHAAAEERAAAADEAAQQLQADLEAAQINLAAAQEQIASSVAGATTTEQHAQQAELAEAAQKLAESTARQQEAEGKLAASEAELDTMWARISALEDEATAAEGAIARLQGERKQLTVKLVAAESAAGERSAAGLEEQLRAAAEQLHAAELRAEAAEAKLAALAAQQAQAEAGGGAAEAEALQAALAEQQQEFGDLLVCLGQESAKVGALQELLEEQGVDVAELLAQVEADYGYGDDAEQAGVDQDEDQAEPQDEGQHAQHEARQPADRNSRAVTTAGDEHAYADQHDAAPSSVGDVYDGADATYGQELDFAAEQKGHAGYAAYGHPDQDQWDQHQHGDYVHEPHHDGQHSHEQPQHEQFNGWQDQHQAQDQHQQPLPEQFDGWQDQDQAQDQEQQEVQYWDQGRVQPSWTGEEPSAHSMQRGSAYDSLQRLPTAEQDASSDAVHGWGYEQGQQESNDHAGADPRAQQWQQAGGHAADNKAHAPQQGSSPQRAQQDPLPQMTANPLAAAALDDMDGFEGDWAI